MHSVRALLAIGLTVVLALAAQAQETPGVAQQPGAAQQEAVVGTIRAQMEAFQRDDGAAAFSHASPRIREIFQTPDIFMDMVRGGYAPVYRPRDVEFLPPRVEGAEILQPVRVIGPTGESVIALYRMQQQPGGDWKIAGVVLLRTGELAS